MRRVRSEGVAPRPARASRHARRLRGGRDGRRNPLAAASGLTELNWPSLDLPVIGQVGGWAFLNSFPQYTPSDDLSIVTALSQFSTPGNALNP